MIDWNVGCSGFHYSEWKKIFYPEDVPQSKWFEFYCSHFNTLELNNTFYQFPKLSTLQSWYRRSPGGFSFSVKVPRLITHYKQLIETNALLTDFYKTVKEGLKEKSGCILFQFPPKFTFTEERLLRIEKQLDVSFNNIVEFRDKSWWQPSIHQQLAEHSITFCGISYPKLPDDFIFNTSIAYYRFHGVPNLYSSPYHKPELRKMIETISASAKIDTAYLYFDNTASGNAVKNATTVRQLINPTVVTL